MEAAKLNELNAWMAIRKAFFDLARIVPWHEQMTSVEDYKKLAERTDLPEAQRAGCEEFITRLELVDELKNVLKRVIEQHVLTEDDMMRLKNVNKHCLDALYHTHLFIVKGGPKVPSDYPDYKKVDIPADLNYVNERRKQMKMSEQFPVDVELDLYQLKAFASLLRLIGNALL